MTQCKHNLSFTAASTTKGNLLNHALSSRGWLTYKISVFHINEEHVHELKPNYDTPTNYQFTPEQKDIIDEGIDSNNTNVFIP